MTRNEAIQQTRARSAAPYRMEIEFPQPPLTDDEEADEQRRQQWFEATGELNEPDPASYTTLRALDLDAAIAEAEEI